MSTLPACPKCNSEYTYQDQLLFICPECGHEWNESDTEEDSLNIKDSVGNPLTDGDTVTLG